MTDRPILFSGPMVRAILDGSKTQTRRVIKKPDRYRNWQVGDRLWVRETWMEWGPEQYLYRADQRPYDDDVPAWQRFMRLKNHKPWKPSIHMPRKASRITLEITRLWEEHLDDMSRGDMVEEGVPFDGSWTKLNADWIKLWDSINDKRGYGSHLNPFVKAIKFRSEPP